MGLDRVTLRGVKEDSKFLSEGRLEVFWPVPKKNKITIYWVGMNMGRTYL